MEIEGFYAKEAEAYGKSERALARAAMTVGQLEALAQTINERTVALRESYDLLDTLAGDGIITLPSNTQAVQYYAKVGVAYKSITVHSVRDGNEEELHRNYYTGAYYDTGIGYDYHVDADGASKFHRPSHPTDSPTTYEQIVVLENAQKQLLDAETTLATVWSAAEDMGLNPELAEKILVHYVH